MTDKNTKPTITLAEKTRLQNIIDELERFGWRAADTARSMRDALKVMSPAKVIALLEELVAEDKAYYGRHTNLVDDQLDHTHL